MRHNVQSRVLASPDDELACSPMPIILGLAVCVRVAIDVASSLRSTFDWTRLRPTRLIITLTLNGLARPHTIPEPEESVGIGLNASPKAHTPRARISTTLLEPMIGVWRS